MTCPTCGTANAVGAKFCRECGTRLATGCPNCGATNLPGARFCNDVRHAADRRRRPVLRRPPAPAAVRHPGAAPSPVAPASSPRRAAPPTERRLVTVLFADLVGFTALAADRDPEAVRELLTRYFDAAREIVERYGGTSRSSSATRSWPSGARRSRGRTTPNAPSGPRSTSSKPSAVSTPARTARGLEAGPRVLTGEAAVTIGATDQGMVAGDLVNTASRLQSVAPPGTVLVGEAT